MAIAFLSVLCAFLFFYGLGDRDLWSSHEGRAAQDAQTILDEGDWGLPRLFDKHLELQKPPLFYWLVAAIAHMRGGAVDAWDVRLPAAAGGMLSVLGLYLFGWWRCRPMMGLVAAVALATAMHFTWLSRIGRIDMPLTLSVGVALLAYFQGWQALEHSGGRNSWKWFAVAYAAVAVAVLLKGPIGIVLPGVVVASHLFMENRLPPPWRWRAWGALIYQFGAYWGVPLVVALTVPWFVWAGFRTNGSLFETFFWYHNVERAFGGSAVLRAHPWWFYAPRFFTDFLPWSPVLAIAVGHWWWTRKRVPGSLGSFGLVWLGAMTLALSCVRFKRADYLVPAYPGAALFLGCAAERWFPTASRRRLLSVALGLVVTACLGGWWWYVDQALPAQEMSLEHRRFADEIRRRAPRPQLILFFRAEAHALAFHLGPPLDTFLEWENLDIWAGRPGTFYIVMPPECAEEWPRHVKSGRLEEVLRSTDLPGAADHERPLVLMRTRPKAYPKTGTGTEKTGSQSPFWDRPINN